MSSPLNAPVSRRLEQMQRQWSQFVASGAPLLLWRVESNERRMVEVFARSTNELEGQDLILRLNTPCESLDSWADALREELLLAWQEVQAPLRAQGLRASWTAPQTGGVKGLAEALTTFRDAMQPLFRLFAVILEPQATAELEQWMLSLAQLLDPSRVRVVWLTLNDEAGADLLEAAPRRVMRISADLDMLGCAREVAQTAAPETPAGQFRLAFIDLGGALARSDLSACREHAARALAVAKAQGWPQMEVAVGAGLAAGLQAGGLLDEAVEVWRRAQALCHSHAAEPWSLPLLVKAQMGLGAVLLAAQRWQEAEQTYGAGAEAAESIKDALSAFECWRMAAWCATAAQAPERAWSLGQRGLSLAEQLDESSRRSGTLPFLGQNLHQIVSRVGQDPRRLEQQLVSLAGPGWQERLPS